MFPHSVNQLLRDDACEVLESLLSCDIRACLLDVKMTDCLMFGD